MEFELRAWDFIQCDEDQAGAELLGAGWLGLTTSHTSRYERRRITEFTQNLGGKCIIINERFLEDRYMVHCLTFLLLDRQTREHLRSFISTLPPRTMHVEFDRGAIRSDRKVKAIWKGLISKLRDTNFHIVTNRRRIIVSYAELHTHCGTHVSCGLDRY